MKRCAATYGAMLAIVLMTGCIVASINPFYTTEAVIEMPSLNGPWSMIDDQGKTRKQNAWLFHDGEIATSSEDGGTGILEVVYFKVGDSVFMDSTPQAADKAVVSEWWTMHTVPIHILSRVETNADRLIIKPLNYDWFVNAVNSNLVSIPVVRTQKNEPALFNGTSENWMGFLKQYGQSSNAFSEKVMFTFVRAAPPPAPSAPPVKAPAAAGPPAM